MKNENVIYNITPINPVAHRFLVSCTVYSPDAAGQRFSLPAWIPGSYMIRDFSRNILSIKASSDDLDVDLSKIDKHTWVVVPAKNAKSITITYEIYAFELSVRHAHLDLEHAFFNGTSVFLRAVGKENLPCLVQINPPVGKNYKNWRVATTLPLAKGEKKCAKPYGFGLYRSANYDELIDHPVEISDFSSSSFSACGVHHDIVLSGRHDCDLKKLTADLKRICEWQIKFFGEPAPIKRYVFIVLLTQEGFGGLEHRSSTTLICPRASLPYAGMTSMNEEYRTLLSLASHEYFHTWNVKRIKPQAFLPYDLEKENYTRMLWMFEGFTSYYDDMILARAGLIDAKSWLDVMSKNIALVYSSPGRFRQSLEESSFDAWIKYYRPDENTPNAVVSYYIKGALVAFCLDLILRHKTAGKYSLDNVMQSLWAQFGSGKIGVADHDVQKIAEEISGLKLKKFFDESVRGTSDLPLAKWLKPFGINLKWQKSTGQKKIASWLGIRFSHEGEMVKFTSVLDNQAAQKAGLSAGDILIALNDWRVKASNIEKLMMRHQPGDLIKIHVFRNEALKCFELRLPEIEDDVPQLEMDNKKNLLREALFNG